MICNQHRLGCVNTLVLLALSLSTSHTLMITLDLRILFTKCVYKSYIYPRYKYKADLALDNLLCLICYKIHQN